MTTYTLTPEDRKFLNELKGKIIQLGNDSFSIVEIHINSCLVVHSSCDKIVPSVAYLRDAKIKEFIDLIKESKRIYELS